MLPTLRGRFLHVLVFRTIAFQFVCIHVIKWRAVGTASSLSPNRIEDVKSLVWLD